MTRLHFLLPLLVLLFGCQNSALKSKKKAQPVPAVVVTSPVTAEPLLVRRRYLGEVWAASEARLSVAEAGRVLTVHVAEGSRVKKGQLLIELDDRLARAELNEARASKEQVHVESNQAGLDATRYSLMEKENVVSQLQAQQQRSAAESFIARNEGAKATVEARQERVARHRLYAPFDGTITDRAVDPGDWLSPGTMALALVTEERLEIHVRVPPALLDEVEDIQSVALIHEGKSTPARLISAVGALDRKTRTGLLRVDCAPAPSWLRAGNSADVEIIINKQGPFNLSTNTLVYGAVGTRVIRARQSEQGLTAESVSVRIVESAGDRVLVEASALKVGDLLVSRGNERLRPGQALTVEGAIAPPVTN